MDIEDSSDKLWLFDLHHPQPLEFFIVKMFSYQIFVAKFQPLRSWSCFMLLKLAARMLLCKMYLKIQTASQNYLDQDQASLNLKKLFWLKYLHFSLSLNLPIRENINIPQSWSLFKTGLVPSHVSLINSLPIFLV